MKKLWFSLLVLFMAIGVSSCSEENEDSRHQTAAEEPSGEAGVDEDDWDICHLGDKKPCYTGPAGTEGVGICKAGFYNCIADKNGDLIWDETRCINQVVPDYSYPCSPKDPSRDHDCNGVPDNMQDDDGDGYTICTNSGLRGDCCDNEHMCLSGGE